MIKEYMLLPNINKVLIIEKSVRFRRLLLRFFAQYFPNAEIKEYHPDQGCPDNTFPWHKFDLLILSSKLDKNNNGLNWLKICKIGTAFPATILITEKDDEKITIEAFHHGVHDCLNREQISIACLKESIERVVNKHTHGPGTTNNTNLLLQTRLINRVALYQRLDKAHGNGAFMLVYIDDFQDICYQIGMMVADDLAIHLANIIITASSTIKTGHVDIIRMNDDIIAITILGKDDNDFYTQFADLLCKEIPLYPFQHDGNPILYSVSIGISRIKENCYGAKTNIAHADIAARLAMNNKGNSFVLFGKNINCSDQKLTAHVKNSIEENRLKPFFQPIINISNDTNIPNIRIFEVRTKLIDNNGRMLGYKDFSPILEKTKLVREFDYRVIRCVMETLHHMKNTESSNIKLLISLEEESLNKDMIQWVNKLSNHFKKCDLSSSIIFEIRSDYFLTNQKDIMGMISGLKKNHDISFALKNVNGLSKAFDNCINKITFEFIKIPMYETTGSVEKTITKNELNHLFNKAKEHGALTISEKIDSARYLSTATECGTDFICGYLVHPPQEDIPLDNEIVM